jgi:hypothetical protein
VPFTTVTADAVVITALPLAGVSVTVTFAGGIVPLGNPVPVTETVVTPDVPVVGLVEADNVTLICAALTAGSQHNTAPNNKRTVIRIALMPLPSCNFYSWTAATCVF